MSATIKERRRNGWKMAEELKRPGDETAGLREIYGWFHEGPAVCRRFTCVALMASLTLMRSLWMSLETLTTITVRPARWPAGEENLLTFDL